MKVVGIIVEYNPMHYGHLHHIKETLALSEADCLIAVMSGHVVQRGEFSSIDKFSKTLHAIKSGVDMVVELPGIFSLQSADLFALASVNLLANLGVEAIYFGSESGSVEPLQRVVDTMATNAYNDALRAFLDEGYSYPSSAHKALETLHKDDVFSQPNNILGIQYIKAIKTLKYDITPVAIKRVDSNYYDDVNPKTKIQSASAIRKLKQSGKPYEAYLPDYVYRDVLAYPNVAQSAWYPYFQFLLMHSTPDDLALIMGFEEGLEHLFYKNRFCESYEAFLNAVVSSRYTYAKIKRAMMHVLLNIKKTDFLNKDVPYIRVLGMNKKGQAWLNEIKHDVTLPLITKLKKEKHPFLTIECRITELYDLIVKQDLVKKEYDFVTIL